MIEDLINSLDESAYINVGRYLPDIDFNKIIGHKDLQLFKAMPSFKHYGKSDILILVYIDSYSNVHITCTFGQHMKLEELKIINYKNHLRKEKLKKFV